MKWKGKKWYGKNFYCSSFQEGITNNGEQSKARNEILDSIFLKITAKKPNKS